MWSRKRLDIGWSDLLAAAAYCVTRWNRRREHAAVEREFSPGGDALCCLSVRSAWDLLLGSLPLQPGEEVLMSALTIPDMVRIVEHHRLVPVPLDLEPDTAAPSPDTLLAAVTPRTKVVLVAHLFGGRIDLDAFLDAAKSRGLLVVEDCAQAYVGPDFRGHPRADASLFSFGTIKTATALGGGLAVIRDPPLLERMRSRQAAYPAQGRVKFFRRIGKYAALKAVSTRRLFGVFVRICRGLGIDYDRLINDAVRGFGGRSRLPGGTSVSTDMQKPLSPAGVADTGSLDATQSRPAGGTYLERFHQQPSAPLLALLRRRLCRYDDRRASAKTSRGELLASLIEPAVRCPGSALDPHNYWVFPVSSDDPAATIARLNRAGFDATQGQSMCVVPAPPGPPGRPEVEPVRTRELLDKLVYVPLYPELPERELRRLAEVLLADAAERAESRPAPALAATA